MSKRPQYEGDPTLARVMVRPRWILALLLALAVGAGFAWLAQWQIDGAINLQETKIDSETTHAIHDLTDVGVPVNEDAAGRMVQADLALVPGDSYIVGSRMNQGSEGFWVVSHFTNDVADEHLTVALGWADTRAEAQDALHAIDEDASLTQVHTVAGRYMPSEGVENPGVGEPLTEFTTLATGQAINLWHSMEGKAFAGYLVADVAPAGLIPIDSFAPLPEEKVNWLNVFYAIEWLVFAGFAVFFWYRLARDAWEKEHEMQELLAESTVHESVE